jgi:hypothetical protein
LQLFCLSGETNSPLTFVGVVKPSVETVVGRFIVVCLFGDVFVEDSDASPGNDGSDLSELRGTEIDVRR